MAVLLEFSDADRPLGVTEIANKLGVHKSTVSRQLTMLSRVGFVAREYNSPKYVLGMGLLPLAASVLAKHQLNAAAKTNLETLATAIDETVTVSGWDGQNAVNLDHIDPPGKTRLIAPPGRLNPFHCTATGKIFLANLSQEDFERRLSEPLRRYTDTTICDWHTLKTQVDEIRRVGFSVSWGEFIPDVFSVAVHMLSEDSQRSYALALTMPLQRASTDRIDGFVEALKTTARKTARFLNTSDRERPR